jgi:hypothetical protein
MKVNLKIHCHALHDTEQRCFMPGSSPICIQIVYGMAAQVRLLMWGQFAIPGPLAAVAAATGLDGETQFKFVI